MYGYLQQDIPKFLSSDIPTFQVNLFNLQNPKNYTEYIGVYSECIEIVIGFKVIVQGISLYLIKKIVYS